MAKVYTKIWPDDTEMALIHKAMETYHPNLAACVEGGLKVNALRVCETEGKPALLLHGYPALAVIRVVPFKQRIHGLGDVEITIDGDQWEKLNPRRRMALLDHEMQHVELVFKDKVLQLDGVKRPKCKLRVHDWELGGFAAIAERHGDDAPELISLQRVVSTHRQLLLFDMGDAVDGILKKAMEDGYTVTPTKITPPAKRRKAAEKAPEEFASTSRMSPLQ